jgi:hypothetical protein
MGEVLRAGVVLFITVLIIGCSNDDPANPNQSPPPPDTTDCPAYDPLAGCANICTGLPPINDLGSGFYLGMQGGLYPNGENTRPASHNTAGIALANQIVPLNTAGNPDALNGRIVMLGVGFSNSREEFERFQKIFDTLQGRNPQLDLVNGAQGGKDVKYILSDTAAFWGVVGDTLALRGLTAEQVQVIWFKQADAEPTDSSFPGYPLALKDKFKTAMHVIVSLFPNVKLCYIASRTYGNYMNSDLNREPWAYYTGWADKMLIEDQINGDPELDYTGPDPQAPWLSWGVYFWADGARPRSDGLTWICPDDYKADHIHMSDLGRQKAAELLVDFFMTDETTTPWFRIITMNQGAGTTPAY